MRITRSTTSTAVFFGLALVTLSVPASAEPIIWTGPSMVFQKPAFADWNLAVNQDRLTGNVSLTRADQFPLFNFLKDDPDPVTGHRTPFDTEWAFGPTQSGDPGPITASNYANLSFLPFVTALAGEVGINVLRYGPGVLHLISDDIYLDIQFTSWTRGETGGGFSYIRSTPSAPVPEPASVTLLVVGALAALGSAARRRKIGPDSERATTDRYA